MNNIFFQLTDFKKGVVCAQLAVVISMHAVADVVSWDNRHVDIRDTYCTTDAVKACELSCTRMKPLHWDQSQ